MNRNEIKKFFANYGSSICLDENLNPVKLLDIDLGAEYCELLLLLEDGTRQAVPGDYKLIPLKGRLKERDYNYVEAKFNKPWTI